MLEHFGGDVKGKVVAIWGLAFKPHTDDVREAPAYTIARTLLDAGASVRLHDPVARHTFAELLAAGEGVVYCDHNYDAVEGADALCLVTEWPAYRRPDFRRVKELMRGNVIFDGRNIWAPEVIGEFGFKYYGIGRR